MNREYIDKLVKCKRVGKLIKLCNDNLYKWSVNDYRYLCKVCIDNRPKFKLLTSYMYFNKEIYNCVNYYKDKICIPVVFIKPEISTDYDRCSRNQNDILLKKIISHFNEFYKNLNEF